MVDDILAVQKCSEDSVRMNAIINAFIEAKKLTLNKTKCHKIHIQKNSKRDEACHKLKAHNDIMNLFIYLFNNLQDSLECAQSS